MAWKPQVGRYKGRTCSSLEIVEVKASLVGELQSHILLLIEPDFRHSLSLSEAQMMS